MLAPTDFDGLVERTREWSELERLARGLTPQGRGQRFNGFLAEVLRCWGIDAQPNQRSLGEIDVAFRIGEQRFIREAKWENRPTDTGSLAKLRTRVQQRLSGVSGVFVSMSGYTHEALDELNVGQRSEVLLFDQQHVAAMLTGVVPPSELFEAALDHAFYTGRPYAPIEELLSAPGEPQLRFGPPVELRSSITEAKGVSALNVVLSEIPVAHLGFTEVWDGVLLVSTTYGVLEVDLDAERVRPVVRITGCTRRPLRVDERVLFVRRVGVGLLNEGRVSAIAGPFRGSITLVRGQDGAPWVFSNGGLDGANAEIAQITEIGGERRHTLPYAGANSRNALWLRAETFAVSGNMGTLVIDLSSGEHSFSESTSGGSNEDGLMRLSGESLLVASDGARLWEYSFRNGSLIERAHIPLPDSGHELEPAQRGTAYLSCPLLQTSGTAAILRCTLSDTDP